MEKQKEEEIEMFQKVAEYFGQIYRSYFDNNATPKLHLLEVHAPMELRKINVLNFLWQTPLRGSISTAKLTAFCLGTSKVGSSATGNLRNEKILLVLQKCNLQPRK